MTELTVNRLIHVRAAGKSWDLTFRMLGMNEWSNDQDLRRAVAHYLDLPIEELEPYRLERHENGNLTIRPEAVFG